MGAQLEDVQRVLAQAQEAGVEVWSSDLMRRANVKIEFFQSVAALKTAVADVQATPLEDKSTREAFAKLYQEAQRFAAQMEQDKTPISADLALDEVMAQAAELVK